MSRINKPKNEPNIVKRGRPRSSEAQLKILKATYELVKKIGFSDLTMEAIAIRAGVGKPTVYRRWPNKARVVLDAFLAMKHDEIAFRSSGSVRKDFRQQMHRLVKLMNSPHGKIIATIIAGAQSDAELLAAYRESWMKPRRAGAKRAFQRGIAAGEFRRDINIDLAIDALYSPLFYRLMLKHAPLTPQFVDDLLKLLMNGVSAT